MKSKKLNQRIDYCEVWIRSIFHINKSLFNRVNEMHATIESLEESVRELQHAKVLTTQSSQSTSAKNALSTPLKLKNFKQKFGSEKEKNTIKSESLVKNELASSNNLNKNELKEVKEETEMIQENELGSDIEELEKTISPELMTLVNKISKNPSKHVDLNIEKPVKRMGYITICSSVATSGRDPPGSKASQSTEGKKSVLFGTADDVENFDKYLKSKGSKVHRQAKYEFSSESLNAAAKEEFLRSLVMFFDSPFNEASLIYYSGHGLANTSLVFETANENYHVTYQDVVSLWRERNNKKNKFLIIVLDCCYAGSWVIELFKNGDFKDVCIQCSSTIDQKSNDLGEGRGSLFTAFLTLENGYLGIDQLNYNEENCFKKMTEQTPRAFISEWSCCYMFFSKFFFNSWQEILKKSYIKTFDQDGIMGRCKLHLNTFNGLYSIFRFIVIMIEEDRLVMQGELPYQGEQSKIAISLVMNSKKIPSNYLGYISIWEEESNMKGIFFRVLNNKEYPFRIAIETIDASISLLTNYLMDDQTEINQAGLLKMIEGLTEINKSNLIQKFETNNIKDEDEENEDMQIFELLTNSYKSKLEKLSIEGNPNSITIKRVYDYLNTKYCSVKVLKIDAKEYADDIGKFDCGYIDKIHLIIHNNVSGFLLKSFSHYYSVFLKSITLEFTQPGFGNRCPGLLDYVYASNFLKEFTLVNPPCEFFNDILRLISDSLSLTTISITNLDIKTTQANLLLQKTMQNNRISSITLKNCNINEILFCRPDNLNYLNLSDNQIINKTIKKLLTTEFVNKYELNISQNYLNNLILHDISKFLLNNKLCMELKMTGNHLNHKEMLQFAQMNLLLKTSIMTLDLSFTLFDETTIKELVGILSKTNHLKSLIAKGCHLQDQGLRELMGFLDIAVSNTISSLDVSDNLVTETKHLDAIRLKVKFSKNLQVLKMRNVVKLSCVADYDITAFFLASQLQELDISYWTAPCKFKCDFSKSAIASGLSHLSLININFKDVVDFNNLKLNSLEIDTTTYKLILYKRCDNLSIIHRQGDDLLKCDDLSTLCSFSVKSDDPIFIEKSLTLFNNSESSDQVSCTINYPLKLLIAVDLDISAATFLLNLVKSESLIQMCQLGMRDCYTFNEEQVKIINSIGSERLRISTICEAEGVISIHNLGSALTSISQELVDIMNRRVANFNKEEFNYGMKFNSCYSPQTKYLSLNRNCLSFTKLLSTKFDNLEIVELSYVYLKKFINPFLGFCEANPMIKVLLIKGSEINLPEIEVLCKIIGILKDSLEELHLVNTFIDNKEIKSLLQKASECKKLSVLNLSSNSIFLSYIITFAIETPSLDTIILRNCRFFQNDIYSLLNLLSTRSYKILDLSGTCLDTNSYSMKLAPSFWDEDQNIMPYFLEMSYSTSKTLLKFSHQLMVLHLFLIDFEENKIQLVNAFKHTKYLPVLKVWKCLKENTFVKSLMTLTKHTLLGKLDLTGNLLSETNTRYLIELILNQFKHGNLGLKINLSRTNMVDKHFEDMFERIRSEVEGTKFKIDFSHNMLTRFSKYYLRLIPNNQLANCRLKCSFSGEQDDIFNDKLTGGMLFLNYAYSHEECIYRSIIDDQSQYSKLLKKDNKVDKLITLQGHSATVLTLTRISDDMIASGSKDCTIKVWQLSSGQCIFTLVGHKDCVKSIIKLKEDILVSASEDKTIKVWQLSISTCLFTLQGHENLICEIIKISDTRIASCSKDKTIKIWSITEIEVKGTLKGHTDCVRTILKFSESLIVSGSDDKTIKVWDLSSGKCIAAMIGHDRLITCLLKLNDTLFASGSKDKTIKIWDIDTSICKITLRGHTENVRGLAKLRSNYIISVSEDSTIRQWTFNSENSVKTYTPHEDSITCIHRLCEDTVMTGSKDNTIRLTIISPDPRVFKKFENISTLEGHTYYVSTILSVNRNRIATGSDDKQIKIWSTETLLCELSLIGHYDTISTLIRMNDDIIISGSWDCTVRTWQLSSASCILTLKAHNSPVTTLMKINDDIIVSGSDDLSLKVWQLSSSTCISTMEGHTKGISSLIHMKDDYIVTGSWDCNICIWRLSMANSIKKYEGHSDSVTCLTKLGSTSYASGSKDKTIKIWDLDKEGCLLTLEGHSKCVSSLITLNFDTIVSSSWDKTIRVWKISKSSCLASFEGHDKPICALLKINDDTIASGAEDNLIKIWKAEDDSEINHPVDGYDSIFTQTNTKYSELNFKIKKYDDNKFKNPEYFNIIDATSEGIWIDESKNEEHEHDD